MKNDTAKKELQIRRNVMIDDTRNAKLTELGGGNLSKGIRHACDAYKAKKKKA